MNILRISLVIGLAAGGARAEGGPTGAEIAAMVAAIEANGCDLTRDSAAAILAASGLSEEVAASVLDVLGAAAGAPGTLPALRISEDRSVMTLVSATCK